MKRRTLIGGLGALATSGFPTIIGAKRTQAATLLDPSKPEDLHLIHRKLNFTLDGRPVYWFIDAIRMGLKDYAFTPFWRMHVGIVYKVNDLDDYRYETKALVKIFYSDLETGKLLETWDNPYTGERRTVLQPTLATSSQIRGLTGEEAKNRLDTPENGPVSTNNRIGPAYVVNDDVWCNADLVVRAEPPNYLDMTIQVNDWMTYQGSISEVSDPDVMSAAATLNFNDVNTFNHPWIGMRDVTANSVSRGYGRKSHSLDGMPGPWKAFMADHHPDVLTDIDGAIEG